MGLKTTGLSRDRAISVTICVMTARRLSPDPAPAGRGSAERARVTVPAPPSPELLAEGGRQRGLDPLEALEALERVRSRKPPTMEAAPAPASPVPPASSMATLKAAESTQRPDAFDALDAEPELEVVEQVEELEELEAFEDVSQELPPDETSGVFVVPLTEKDLLERALSFECVPVVRKTSAEIRALPLDPAAAFLVSAMDGMVTIEMLFDLAPMPREAVARALCLLFDHGAISFG
jgi:hypothetical protein